MIRDRLYALEEWPGVIHTRTILAAASAERVLLEIGCGRDAKQLKQMASHFGYAIGVDIEVANERTADGTWSLVRADAHRLPLRSESVDVIAMAHVVEHLTDPTLVMRECARVLRPGGRLVVYTVNKWFAPIILGRLFPHRLRQSLNRIASATNEEDTFPAYYRANGGRSLVAAAQSAGLCLNQLRYLSQHPRYLMFSVTVYRLGILVERLLRRHHSLRHLRHFIHAVFRK